MQFNEKLKELRLKKGITQTALAEKIFVSRSAVAKWENGFGLPSDESLNLLAEFFGVEPSELMSDPIIETAIVTKNSTISKQKLWIILISVSALIAIAVLITLCVCFIKSPSKPIITRQMIFETEKGIDTKKIVSYNDDEISVDSTFADSRTFEIKYGVGVIRLPELLVKTTVNGYASYERVDYSNCVFSCSDNIIIRCEQDADNTNYISVLPKEFYEIEFNEWANIKYGEFLISIRVFRNHIAVERVTVRFYDNSSEIGLTQSKSLRTSIEPYNASYSNYTYTMERIVRPNGEEYSGDLSEYAYIDKYELTTTSKIEIGSVIYISATADYDNVKSNVFAATVVRVGISNILFRSSPVYTSAIDLGESLALYLTCWPNDASFSVLGEQATVTLLTPELATLEKTDDGWLLTATDDIKAVDEKIYVKVETPEGVSETFDWDIMGIPVKSIMLINLDTGEELDEVTYINRNGTLRLTAVIAPENATYDKINYNVFVDLSGFGIYVDISDDGVLTVSDKAPFDMEIFVSASAGRYGQSVTYKIIVQ